MNSALAEKLGMVKCSACEGTGEIVVAQIPGTMTDPPEDDLRPCEACDGLRMVEDEITQECEQCGEEVDPNTIIRGVCDVCWDAGARDDQADMDYDLSLEDE